MKVNDFQKDRIYLDTNFIYHFLRPVPEYGHDIMAFSQRIEEGNICAYTCVNTFDELKYRLLLALIKEKYGSNPLDLLRSQAKAMLREFYPKIQEVLITLKSFPNLEILSLTSQELFKMILELASIKLLPRDALHLTVMKNHGISFIASDDRDFDGIQGIERVWLYNQPLG